MSVILPMRGVSYGGSNAEYEGSESDERVNLKLDRNLFTQESLQSIDMSSGAPYIEATYLGTENNGTILVVRINGDVY